MQSSWLDFKLGRVLVKYPGLTLVGVLAIAVAMPISAAAFEFGNDMLRPSLPLEDGDRIVAIQNWDTAAAGPEYRSLHDFAAWREEVKSVEEIGAYTTLERNVITEDGRAEPVPIAEISASAFRIARVAPLMGRPLVDADEQPGAPSVVVMGYAVWQTRFGGDSAVVGRTVQLGTSQATVVGVMPQGFGFPTRHRLWRPLRVNVSEYERLQGPTIRVFDRLARNTSLEEAQAEPSAIGSRAAAAFPATNERLRPRVVPFAKSFVEPEMEAAWYVMQSILVMLLVVACANVATLIYARTATRETVIVVRTALGASRLRIVAQLFIEALVLTSVGAVVGLAAADWGLAWAMDLFWSVQGDVRPFWWNDNLSATTVLYVALLTLLGAAVVGLLPALKGRSGGSKPIFNRWLQAVHRCRSEESGRRSS
jgi:putative ABC transport system permease protein